jgi:hypothetical protein
MEKYWQKVTKIFHLLPFKVKIRKISSSGMIGKRLLAKPTVTWV